ncbi:MAG: universal stress protein [Stappiaceae bacterium]
MAIKDILNLVDLNGNQPSTRVALDLARQCDAHLTGVSVAFDRLVQGFVAAEVPSEYIKHAREQSFDMTKKSLSNFDELARKAGVKVETRMIEMVEGGNIDPFLTHTRLTDLLVIGQEKPDSTEPMRDQLIEAALFDSGVPMLLVPYAGHDSFSADHIMVAWDGSRTASRAVHAGLPILELAKKVSIVIVENGKKLAGEGGADIATYLSRHGVKVAVQRIKKPPIGVADTLLNFIADEGVNLTVMGGYGHSRMREFILGGATRGMLATMTVPVLMAH